MSVQPIERNTIQYALYFEREDLTLPIQKPGGIEKADFEIKQNTNGYGRYLTFADSVEVQFVPRLNHQFTKLCEYYKLYKWQTSIYFIITVDSVELYRGRLKLNTVQTDYTFFYKCNIDVNNQREIIEAKKSETINLLSTQSLDNEEITPVQMEDLLTKFKDLFVDSVIELEPYPLTIQVPDNSSEAYFDDIYLNIWNKSNNPNKDVTVGGSIISKTGYPGVINHENFTSIKNGAVVSEVMVNIRDIDITFNLDRIPFRRLYRRITNFDDKGNYLSKVETDMIPNVQDNHLVVPDIHEMIVLQPYQELMYFISIGKNIQNVTIKGSFTFNKKPTLNFLAAQKYENTVTPACRLIDVGRQCLKSITNNAVTVTAPRFLEPGGNFYDIFATSGLFLRQYENEPFYASWKAFADYILNSFNCDYQINGTDIFIGHQSDFYQDKELSRVLFSANDNTFKVVANTRLVKSNFSLGYEKFEDDKASSNTLDSIHVRSEWYLNGSQPLEDAQDDRKIGYVADQYKIENTRRESFNKDSTKTIPNDKDIYVIDSIVQDGVLQNRTNQGFPSVENLYSPATCYNLRLSVKRLLLDYFSNDLANIAQFTSGWKNTLYLNNRTAKTQADSTVVTTQQEIIEGADILPEQLPPPTLTGDVYELDLAYRVKYDEFMKLASKIINERGYITLYTKEGAEIKLYVSNLKYSWENEKIYNIKGERKHA